jgi:hypothetical protein
MKRQSLLWMLLMCCIGFLQAEPFTFTVQGKKKTYNQLKFVNDTRQTNFRCRLSVVPPVEDNKEAADDAEKANDKAETANDQPMYFNLKGAGDSDACMVNIKRGSQLTVDLPKDFPAKASFTVEYKEFPLYHAIIIHILEESEF